MKKHSAKKGLVIVLTGGGKGKTSAALGMALRACGHGMKVCIIQFLKGTMYSGERDALRMLGGLVELVCVGEGFCTPRMSKALFQKHKQAAQNGLELARRKVQSGGFEMVILDEINIAVHLGLIDAEQILELIHGKPPDVHIVLTGRNAPREVIEVADIVTELIEVKHPHRRGGKPQRGIEY